MIKWSKMFFERKIGTEDKLRLKTSQLLSLQQLHKNSQWLLWHKSPFSLESQRHLLQCLPRADNNWAAAALCHHLSSWPAALLSPWAFCAPYIHLQFLLSTYAASGLALFVVGFLFVCLVLWFLWDSVVDVTPLGAVITWIKSFHCSSHTFCFTKNWGGGKCWQEGKRK